jgi:hypothetical protein
MDNEMSDTPRTDAEEKGASYFTGVEIRQAWNLARQLERELAEYKRMLDEALDTIKRWEER